MFRKKPIAIAVAASMLIAAPVSANVGTGMNDLFNSLGGFSNTTPPSAYKGQTMNGYSGGGFYARTPVKNYQLMSAQAPSLNIGCGGIDFTAGSFSHINEAALTGMMQNIGTAITYAFLLAIKSSMPEMASLFEYLQDVAAKANALNINTCQLTRGIPLIEGGSLSDNITATAGQLASNTTSLYSDSMQALKATKDDAAKRNEAINAAIAADPSKKDFYRPGNVVWRALSKTSGLDREDKELIMSLTGAIVIGEPTGSGTGNGSKAGAWNYIEPTITDVDEFIGYKNETTGTIKMLQCDETVDCKNPTPVDKTITSFRAMVSAKIDALRNNLNNRTAQTVSDLKFIEVSRVPIWKMIAISHPSDTSTIEMYKNYIAVDVAYTYVERMLLTAKQILANHEAMASPDASEALAKLTDKLNDLSQYLSSKRIKETESIISIAERERQLQFMHQAMLAGLPAQAFNSMQVFGK